jgi:hypothetical protein
MTTTVPALSALSDQAAEAAIGAATRTLQLPTIRDQAIPMAAAASKQRLSHKAYLAEVLSAECDERDARRQIRRVKEAKLRLVRSSTSRTRSTRRPAHSSACPAARTLRAPVGVAAGTQR